MHIIRWIIAIGWIMIIASLFIDDGFTINLTDPNWDGFSPIKDYFLLDANSPETCVRLQGECQPQPPYYPGARIFWGAIVPIGLTIVFVLGHEFWRRICPLYFLSQIPRALGIKPRVDFKKKEYDNHWLKKNHLFLQFVLFFIGLNVRILFVNSDRLALASFLTGTIIASIVIVYIYGGRSWCHYVCPFGMVQMVFNGPRGVLDSEAHKAPRPARGLPITQSMCREVKQDKDGNLVEQSACISCKSLCLDIDSEKAHWNDIHKPGRRLVQYGYLGLLCGYFLYYFFYSGNFWYYYSGIWTHEVNQLGKLFYPGFSFFGPLNAIPKIIATPLTLLVFSVVFYYVFLYIEKGIYSNLKKKNPEITRDIAIHRTFSIVTFISFNAFFVYAGRPELIRLHGAVQPWFPYIVNALALMVSGIWLYRTWARTPLDYNRENNAFTLRKQLKKSNVDFKEMLKGRDLDDLNTEELYLLADVLESTTTKEDHLEVYKGILQDALEEARFKPADSKAPLVDIRHRLKITEEEHDDVLGEVLKSNRELMDYDKTKIKANQEAKTVLGVSNRGGGTQKTVLGAFLGDDKKTRIDVQDLKTKLSINLKNLDDGSGTSKTRLFTPSSSGSDQTRLSEQ